MNILVADRIVSSCGVNIQLWASGAFLHYKDSEELLHLLAVECNDNFHFFSNVQTIPPRPFKTFFTRFNLHMKGNNISKEFFFKKKKSLCIISLMSTNSANSVPQSKPAGGRSFCRCKRAQHVRTVMKNSTTYTTTLIRLHWLLGDNTINQWTTEKSHSPLAVSPFWAKPFST